MQKFKKAEEEFKKAGEKFGEELFEVNKDKWTRDRTKKILQN